MSQVDNLCKRLQDAEKDRDLYRDRFEQLEVIVLHWEYGFTIDIIILSLFMGFTVIIHSLERCQV